METTSNLSKTDRKRLAELWGKEPNLTIAERRELRRLEKALLN